MTKFGCGCHIMTEVITLNEWKQSSWSYLLKAFINMCGECGKKQMKFQHGKNTFRDGKGKGENVLRQ